MFYWVTSPVGLGGPTVEEKIPSGLVVRMRLEQRADENSHVHVYATKPCELREI